MNRILLYGARWDCQCPNRTCATGSGTAKIHVPLVRGCLMADFDAMTIDQAQALPFADVDQLLDLIIAYGLN